jgi:hypothetical protein
MNPLYNEQLTLEQVQSITGKIKNEHEIKIRKEIKILLEQGFISKEKSESLYNDAESFLNKDYAYFANGQFINNELSRFRDIAIQTANAYHDHRFRQFKRLLEHKLSGYQAAIQQNSNIKAETV